MVRSPRSGRLRTMLRIAGRTIQHDRGLHPSRRRYAAPQDEVWHGYGPAISRHDLPELWPWFSPREGAGNAGCTLHPRSRVQWVKGSAHEHTGSAEALRHSLRNGFTAYTCSPRRRIPFCHRRQRIEICLSPVGPTHLRWLDISHGCQNHTTSPYAAPSPAPPTGEMPTEVLAKALKRRSSAQTLDRSRENPPCNHDRARRRCVHRIQPRVRDDRDTPLIRDRMARAGSRDLPDGERGIFLRGGLDGANRDEMISENRANARAQC